MTPTRRPSPPTVPPSSSVPTVRQPGPSQERALIDALHRRDAATRDVLAASAPLDDAALMRAHCAYERERAARLAATCCDCGGAAVAGRRRCMTCELATG